MTESTEMIASEAVVDAGSVDNMSETEMDNFFKNDQAEEANNPIANEESSDEQQSAEALREQQRTEGQSSSEKSAVETAELSNEDGREERDPEQLSSDGHERSYKVALKEERALRQERDREAQDLRESNKKMSEAFNKLVEAAEKPTQPQIPNYEDDPIGNMNAKLDAANRQIAELSGNDQQRQQEVQDRNNQARFNSDYEYQSAQFENDNPDYKAARNHLISTIRDDYIAQGLTHEQASNQVKHDETMMAVNQMTQKNNPAKVIYDMAKRRGYQAPSAEGSNMTSNNLDKMERMERGAKASRSLTNKGESPNDRVTLEEITQLSDEEFDKLDWNKVLKMG